MKAVAIEITLEEFVSMIRKSVKEACGYDTNIIQVISHDSIRIIIDETNLVTCEEFSHRASVK